MFEAPCLRVELHGEGISELCFDRHDGSINKFDARTIAGLDLAAQAIRAVQLLPARSLTEGPVEHLG